MYRAKATKLTEAGELEEAEKILKEAIQATPEEPWLYYDLAFIYQQKGLTDKARSLFNNVLWQFPLNSQLRYSHALFLRALDDYQGALATLQYIPFKSRDADIVSLEHQLQLNESLAQSERFINSQNKAAAIYHLSALEAQNLTPPMKAELARSWFSIEEQNHALKLMRDALAEDPSLSAYWHMLYGEWLLAQGNKAQTTDWFNRYRLPENASEGEIDQFVQLQYKRQRYSHW